MNILGNEFFNSDAYEIYRKFGIGHYPLRAPLKASMAEISGRYILDRLYKYLKWSKQKRWVDKLDEFVHAKNTRKNRTLGGMASKDIDFQNQGRVFETLYPNAADKPKFMLQVNQRVQVVKEAMPFAKSFHGYYNERQFHIIKRHAMTVPRYSIADDEDNMPISGTWYAHELYPV